MTRRVVADASVVLKWFLPAENDERHVDAAFDLLGKVRSEEVALVEPPHWLAEVAAVLARLTPFTAERDVEYLCALSTPVEDSPEIYHRAVQLARRHAQHVFDTLYHAVALQREGVIYLTDDTRYFKAAASSGGIALLEQWPDLTAG